MNNSEFVNVRGQNLMANSVWAAGQEFLIIAIPPHHFDSATADILAQQAIEITPGLKITEKATGKLFEVLSGPEGYSRHVQIKDVRRNLNPVHIPEDELRQKYRFSSV
jgi:hypothetical protein